MSNMAVQMNYGEPSRGMPGGLYDRAEYEAVTRRNSAEDKALCFGYGVVQGTEPGKDIALPATDATADKFEGVVMYSANVEMDDDGAVLLRKNQIVDVSVRQAVGAAGRFGGACLWPARVPCDHWHRRRKVYPDQGNQSGSEGALHRRGRERHRPCSVRDSALRR